MYKEVMLDSVVQFNDFKKQWDLLKNDVCASVDRVGKSGWLVLGQEVQAFEGALAKMIGVRAAVGCGNGLDALTISLLCLGIKPGDKVLTTPLSAFATTLAIVNANAVPVFVDVDEYGLLSLDHCEEVLKQNKDIRAMVPVHLYGHALDLKRLKQLRETYGIALVEDCAQAIGAMSLDLPVGSVGDMSALSFYPTKNLGAMGDGGAILSNNMACIDQAKSLRNYGQTKLYYHDVLGFNSRLDELQAAILRTAILPRFSDFTKRRQTIASYYQKNIQNSFLTMPKAPTDSHSVWHLFPVIVEGDKQHFMSYLKAHQVMAKEHYPVSIPAQKALQGIDVEIYGELNNTQKFNQHELSLPIHPFLEEKELAYVADVCNAYKG